MAVLGRGACVYCGAVVEVAGASSATKPAVPGAAPVSAVPPELLIALDPSLQPGRSAGERWLVRIVALGLAALVIGVVAMFTLAK
jgi:hypothetical protein